MSKTENEIALFLVKAHEAAHHDTGLNISTSKEDLETYFAKAKKYFKKNKYEKAFNVYKTMLSLKLSHRMKRIIQNLQACSLMKLGKFKEAFLLYQEILKPYGPWENQPKDVIYSLFPILLNLASVHYALGNYQESKSLCDKILKLKPDNKLACQIKGDIHYCCKEYAEAISNYTKAIIIKPIISDSNWINACYDRGRAYYHRGQYQKAIEDFDQVITANPQDIEALVSKGLSHYKLTEYKLAASCFQKGIDINSNLEYIWNNMASVHYALGENDKSLMCYERALKINPYSINAITGIKDITKKTSVFPTINYEVVSQKMTHLSSTDRESESAGSVHTTASVPFVHSSGSAFTHQSTAAK